jgi:hypothetical protein
MKTVQSAKVTGKYIRTILLLTEKNITGVLIAMKFIHYKYKTMKNKIKEVQDYFKNSILNNEFEFVEFKYYEIIISIDDYQFDLWVANGAMSLRCYETGSSFMDLEFSASEKVECYAVLKLRIDEYEKNEGHQKKLEEYAALKEELGIKE